jgi:carboxyl-terminal processing protease
VVGWSRSESSQSFTRIIVEELHTVDGILLDLRDGWGGAWYEYLDPFYENRDDFYASTIVRRGSRTVTPPDASRPHPWFQGPLVVLVNEGTRSGKEAMAFQFKKTKRAILVGTTTAGAFTGGMPFFSEQGYVLNLAYNGPIQLDGQEIEGVGISPDVRVQDRDAASGNGDPQLERGREVLRGLLTNPSK